MPSVSIPTAVLIGAGVTGAAGLAAASMGSSAAKSAANTQAAAADKATQAQTQMFNTTQTNLKPFIDLGTGAAAKLGDLTGTNPGGNPLTAALTSPIPIPWDANFAPTMDQLEQTPGYQFTRDQGLKSVQNSYAAQGLGQSGAALKGAADYASGLASTTFNQQFQNWLSTQNLNKDLRSQMWDQRLNIYNQVAGVSQLGEGAASGQGQVSAQVGQQIGANITSAGNAQAAGTIGSANAISSGINSLGAAGSNAALMLALNGSGMFGGTMPASALNAPAGGWAINPNQIPLG